MYSAGDDESLFGCPLAEIQLYHECFFRLKRDLAIQIVIKARR